MQEIKGFEGLYSITKQGDVISHAKIVKVGNKGGYRIQQEKPLKKADMNGYCRVHLYKNNKVFAKLVHRLIAEAYIPNPENLPWINHIDANTKNNSINNLEWCTPKQNSQHAYKMGLMKKIQLFGEKNGSAKLTESTVRQMRAMYEIEPNCSKIARHFKVNPRTAYDICHGRKWKHLI